MTYTRYGYHRGISLLDQQLARMANCWWIYRKDAVQKFLTDHDQPLTFGGNTYTPSGGANASDLSSESGVKEDNLEIIGVIDDSVISTDDLRDGLYDGATVIHYVVDWLYPWTSIFEQNVFYIGDVTWNKDSYRCQMAGITQQLDRTIGRTAQETCPYVFGEYPCQRDDLDPVEGPTIRRWGCTTVYTPLGDDPARWFQVDTLPVEVNGYYNKSRVEFVSGDLAGSVGYIKSYWASPGPRLIELILPMKISIPVGETVYIYNVCDRTLQACQEHGNNKNFGGCPDMPGMDKMEKTVDSKS